MAGNREIVKIGLAAVRNGRLLVVRKRGKPSFILPGGKPEPGEADNEALAREIREELGCSIGRAIYLGTFSDRAADLKRMRVTVRLYCAPLSGRPRPAAEIEECTWIDLHNASGIPLAPSLVNHILPYLRRKEMLRGVNSSVEQGSAIS